MTRRRVLVALPLASALLACAGWLWIDEARQMFGIKPAPIHDLVVKYQLIHDPMDYEEAVQLLGEPAEQWHPGCSRGDHILWWKDEDATLVVKWDGLWQLAESPLQRKMVRSRPKTLSRSVGTPCSPQSRGGSVC
jgi:hypothetical protein